MIEAAETRKCNRGMKELAAEDAAKRSGTLMSGKGIWILLEIGEILMCL
jgi:hypothetical protein